MANSVYHINKAINKPIEFKGLKAQYIWYLGGSLVGLLLLFAVLYFTGLSPYLCVAFTLGLGTTLFVYIYSMSDRYGEFGLMKKMARKAIPKVIKNSSLVRLKRTINK